MTCNNYYTPKIYDVTNGDLKSIKINFTDAFGEEVKLKYNTTESVNSVDEEASYRAAFRMECELAIIDEK
jgi:argonaute-like protein implicated in RNA metabolism and viral defense